MKKIITIIISIVMLLTLSSFTVFASVSYSDKAPNDLGKLIIKAGPTTNDITESSGSVINLSESCTSFCPKSDCWVRYEFSAEKAGDYTFVIEYIARPGKTRGLDYAIDSIDPGRRVLLKLEQSEDKRYAIVLEKLEVGTHSVYFFCPTGFDDTELKSCDVYGISVYLTKEAEVETTLSDAPKTADTAMLAAFAFALSATAAIVVAKKHVS